ncbi:MAG: hypothetical protein ACR2NB_12770 [Solirubrobacteraceae bacterium]
MRNDRALVLLAVPRTLGPQPPRQRVEARYRGGRSPSRLRHYWVGAGGACVCGAVPPPLGGGACVCGTLPPLGGGACCVCGAVPPPLDGGACCVCGTLPPPGGVAVGVGIGGPFLQSVVTKPLRHTVLDFHFFV